jgi:hypothetical protein
MRIVRHVYYLGVGTTASFHHKRRLGKHKTKLTPPLLIEVYIPSQESERSCIEVYIPSQESERSCIEVYIPSQESERSCIEVYIPRKESERSCIEVYIYQARKVSGHVLKCIYTKPGK